MKTLENPEDKYSVLVGSKNNKHWSEITFYSYEEANKYYQEQLELVRATENLNEFDKNIQFKLIKVKTKYEELFSEIFNLE